MTTVAFFQLGSETSFVQGIQSEKYPYSVSLNSKATPPTLNDAEILLTSAHMGSLKDRVQVDLTNETVDRFFKVERNNNSNRNLALKAWGDLQWKSKVIGFGSGISAVVLTLIALQGAPAYIIVALYAGTVASTCLAGWSLHRYHVADKELALWRSPGEDFAKKRKDSLLLSLPEMSKKKCHFHPQQLTGTLLGVEMLLVFRRDFKQFAIPLLDRKCDTDKQQHKWVLDFFKGNPFRIEFFKENPHLASEQGWDNVQKFQIQIFQLIELMKTLEETYVLKFNNNLEEAKKKLAAIQQEVSEKANAFCKEQKIDSLRCYLDLERVKVFLNTECLGKIRTLGLREQARANFFGSLVYSQVRALLEEAQKVLLEDLPYTLVEDIFTVPEKFIPGNFQEELDATTASYPQNVIEKAKADTSKGEHTKAYLSFIDAVFA